MQQPVLCYITVDITYINSYIENDMADEIIQIWKDNGFTVNETGKAMNHVKFQFSKDVVNTDILLIKAEVNNICDIIFNEQGIRPVNNISIHVNAG
jgi:hypothetical protein